MSSWKKHLRTYRAPNVIAASTQAYSENRGTSYARTASNLPEIYAGHPNRVQRYYQYEEMGRDSDVAAALDTIADFCTQSEEQLDTPFDINYLQDPSESEVKVIKEALNIWIKRTNLKHRLWKIFRDAIQYGDAFFVRDPETAEWYWIDPFAVELVKMSSDGSKEPEEYVIKNFDPNVTERFGTGLQDISQYRNPNGATPVSSRPMTQATTASDFQMAGTENDFRRRTMNGGVMGVSAAHVVLDAKNVIHLSMSEGMDPNWPFGKSILEAVYKTYKQKSMLEDAILIYRVQRAPERRIFYIDVGQANPIKAKQQLEAIKNEIHQRRIPNRTTSGQNIMDTAYSPLAILDDYYFAQNCLRLSTKINLLDGRTLPLSEIIREYEGGKVNYAYSLNTKTHEFEAGKIAWAGVTRRNAEMVRVTLDNGEYVDATPDHRFILRDGSEVEAKDLMTGTSLMPLYLSDSKSGKASKSTYTKYVCNATGKTKFVHIELMNKSKGRDFVVHHIDFNSHNNNPDNLVVMDAHDHTELHRQAGSYSAGKQWKTIDGRAKLIAGMRHHYDNISAVKKSAMKLRNSLNGSNTWLNETTKERVLESLSNQRKIVSQKRTVKYNYEMFARVIDLYDAGHNSLSKIIPVLKQDELYRTHYTKANESTIRNKDANLIVMDDGVLNKLVAVGGYLSWNEFKKTYANNHKVASMEYLQVREDTGDLTIESASNSHVFAVAAGVYVHNSEGRGSKVEVLPSGDALGEITDLSYFTKKMARGLRIPTSYLSLSDDDNQASFNDGKMGQALIQEFRFNKYCMRLQGLLAPVFEKDFKQFLDESGVEYDANLFELMFLPPQNFTKYRQIELDAQQAQVYMQLAGVKVLAERYKLKRYLNMSDDELLENEGLWIEENSGKFEHTTGGSPADAAPDGDLGSVGIRPPDDFGMGMDEPAPDDMSMDMPEGPNGPSDSALGTEPPVGGPSPATPAPSNTGGPNK